jgi:hypothetical protein
VPQAGGKITQGADKGVGGGEQMTPEKQNAVIAIACGIVTHDHWGPLHRTPQGLVRVCPDFVGDLNACHEMEKVLTDAQKKQFVFWLNHLHPSADIHYSDRQNDMRLEVFSLIHSTAAQKSKAFLHTLGLWTETPTQPQ